MKAYVQQVRESNSIYLAMMQADHWFGQRGYEVVRFEFADVADGVLDDDLLKHPDEMVVRGGVGTIRQLLQRAGRPLPPNIDLPQSLSKWIGRQFWQSTLGQIRASINSEDFRPIHRAIPGTLVHPAIGRRDIIPGQVITNRGAIGVV